MNEPPKSLSKVPPIYQQNPEARPDGEPHTKTVRRWAWEGFRCGAFDWMDRHGPFEMEAPVKTCVRDQNSEG